MTAEQIQFSVSVWETPKKSGVVTDELQKKYQHFRSKHHLQRRIWLDQHVSKLPPQRKETLQSFLISRGFKVDWTETGRLSYTPSFKPLQTKLDICFVRHGKTEGNTEPRIFQGYVDYSENQLSDVGKQQAIIAAEKMEELFVNGDFKPDLIVMSPLGRAIETAIPFLKKHPQIPVKILESASEMHFGSWDNVQLRYFDSEDICHLFYLDQNVLVQCPEPHQCPNGDLIPSECFVDVMMRQEQLIQEIENLDVCKKLIEEGKRPKVLIYGHSMAGGALAILLGRGKKIKGTDDQIGFDSEYVMPNAVPNILTPISTPFS